MYLLDSLTSLALFLSIMCEIKEGKLFDLKNSPYRHEPKRLRVVGVDWQPTCVALVHLAGLGTHHLGDARAAEVDVKEADLRIKKSKFFYRSFERKNNIFLKKDKIHPPPSHSFDLRKFELKIA